MLSTNYFAIDYGDDDPSPRPREVLRNTLIAYSDYLRYDLSPRYRVNYAVRLTKNFISRRHEQDH